MTENLLATMLNTPETGSGVWIPLPQLLSLPLPASALAVLWRYLLLSLPAEAVEERQAIEAALLGHEVTQLDVLIEQDRLEEMFSRMESLAGQLSVIDLSNHLSELLPRLHELLVDQAGSIPAPEVLADERRAELLWLSDQWMRCLEQQLSFKRTDRLSVIAEQLCRYGALAWMEQKGTNARQRALSLLDRLHRLLPEASDWVLQGISERLLETLEELTHKSELTDPDQLQEMLEACRCLADNNGVSAERRSSIDQAVFRGLASLQLWREING